MNKTVGGEKDIVVADSRRSERRNNECKVDNATVRGEKGCPFSGRQKSDKK